MSQGFDEHCICNFHKDMHSLIRNLGMQRLIVIYLSIPSGLEYLTKYISSSFLVSHLLCGYMKWNSLHGDEVHFRTVSKVCQTGNSWENIPPCLCSAVFLFSCAHVLLYRSIFLHQTHATDLQNHPWLCGKTSSVEKNTYRGTCIYNWEGV